LFFIDSQNRENGSVPLSIHFLPKTLFLEDPLEKTSLVFAFWQGLWRRMG